METEMYFFYDYKWLMSIERHSVQNRSEVVGSTQCVRRLSGRTRPLQIALRTIPILQVSMEEKFITCLSNLCTFWVK